MINLKNIIIKFKKYIKEFYKKHFTLPEFSIGNQVIILSNHEEGLILNTTIIKEHFFYFVESKDYEDWYAEEQIILLTDQN